MLLKNTPEVLADLDLEHLPVGVMARDSSNRIVYVNATICEWLGYARDELVGQPVPFVVADELEGLTRERMASVDSGMPPRALITTMQTKSGETSSMVVVPWPFRDETGLPSGGGAVLVRVSTVVGALRLGGKSDTAQIRTRLFQIAIELDALSMAVSSSGTEVVPFTHPRLEGLLTRREREVVSSIVNGESVPEIARNMSIESGTVRTHLGRVFRKVGVGSQVELRRFIRGLSS